MCERCGNRAEVKAKFSHGGKNYYSLKCGHTLNETQIKAEDYSDFRSSDGRSLREYQVESCHFGEKANFRCLFAHQQGLGKTVIALALLKKHQEKLTPTLIVCKSSLKYQWFHEVLRWTGLVSQIIEGNDRILFDVFPVFIVSFDLLRNAQWINDLEGKIKLLIIDECQAIKNAESKRTYFVRQIAKNTYTENIVYTPNLEKRKIIETKARDLMAYHGLGNRYTLEFGALKDKVLGQCESYCTKDGIIEGKIQINRQHAENDPESEVIETILHEIAHAITPGAGHSKIWIDTSLAIGGNGQAKAWCFGTKDKDQETRKPISVIALSGTPIKNRADEYYPILNILRPEVFYSRKNFESDWIGDFMQDGKWKKGRLLDPELFKKKTADYILRFTRDEVAKDLPPVNRTYSYSNLGDEVEKKYKMQMKLFTEFFDENDGNIGGKNYGTTLAFLSKMRHLTGLSKVGPAIEKLEEFLDNEDEEKIVLFHHHIDVGDEIEKKLTEILKERGFNAPLRLDSSLSSESRYKVCEEFRLNPKNRVLIASTLASGEGLNLQFCSFCIMLERQWNPANEEQAEGRFPRIGRKEGAPNSISADYMLALGTIDEFFTELVENKRKIVNEALDGKEANWNENDLMMELSEKLVSHGRKKWKF